jgi:hypothetical protein
MSPTLSTEARITAMLHQGFLLGHFPANLARPHD